MAFKLDELKSQVETAEARQELYRLADEEVNPSCYDTIDFPCFGHRIARGTAI